MSKYPHPIFRNYLEGEDDKPYYTMNSLAFYYEDMERKQKLIESLAKSIAGYDIRLTENLESIEQEVDKRLADWDKQLETFPASVEDLLTKWTTDGTIDQVIQTALIDEKIQPLTTQLAEKVVQNGRAVNILDLGAIGDGVTDNTNVFRNLINGKNVYIPEGVFITEGFTINSGTTIKGAGIQKSVIKLKANSNSDLVTVQAGTGGKTLSNTITGVTLDGNKANNTAPHITTSVLKWYTIYNFGNSQSVNDEYPNKSFVSNIEVVSSAGNGIYLAGLNRFEYESGKFSTYNWIFHLTDVWVVDCNRYGIWDQTTDNLYSNINVSHCGRANLFTDRAGNNRYNNVKLDGQMNNFPEVYDNNKTAESLINDGGALLVINNCDNLLFTNLDAQSGAYTGIKVHNSKDCILNGSVTNNGLYAGENTGGAWGSGVGMRITASNYISGNIIFSSVRVPSAKSPSTPFYQGVDVQIPLWKNSTGGDVYSYYCTILSQGAKEPVFEIGAGSTATCTVKRFNTLVDLDVLKNRGDLIVKGTYQPLRLPIGAESQVLQSIGGSLAYSNPSKIIADSISNVPPDSPSSPGAKGSIRYDVAHIYLCIETNQWVKLARTPF